MHGRIAVLGFALILLAGCSETPEPSAVERADQATPPGREVDPAKAGVVQGRVVWEGPLAIAEEQTVRAIAFNPRLHLDPARFIIPHIPKVQLKSRGVENAIVYLRHADPTLARSWNHPPVQVEFKGRQLIVAQGGVRSAVGIVRRGDAISIVNRDAEYHRLQLRGAAFSSLPLIQPDRVHERKMSEAGVVELSCGAGYYWLHAHLLVAEHPYYARTDSDGKFMLDMVPAGKYEVVCWLPTWRVERQEVDPETGIIARQKWEAPKEQTRSVEVSPGKTSELTYAWSLPMFVKQ